MASSSSKRRSTRQMAGRKRSRYVEPETDDDIMPLDDFDSDTSLPRELAPSPPKRQRRVKVKHTPKTRSRSTVKKEPVKRRKRAKIGDIGRPLRARRAAPQPEEQYGRFIGPSHGVIPPWTTLPTEILRDVFTFAGQPLTAENATWLIGAARTCRAFMEPALEALYYWPAIWHPISLVRLLRLLQRREGRLMKYNTKIKRLDIDVRRLAYQAHNTALFDLSTLIPELPRLQHLEIVHPQDKPPYRMLSLQSWLYPDALFMSLDTAQIRLSAWRWTAEMLKDRPAPYEFMTSVHKSKAFGNLRELVLCGFQPTTSHRLQTPIVEGEPREADLLAAINALPNLKDVSMISCEVVEKDWLDGLPTGLERLELSNCQYVYTENITSFLTRCGSQLQELVLNHNPAVALSFLTTLKSSCPRLHTLEMDLHFYSQYVNISVMDPEYDVLLGVDEVPTWPTTMRQIDLVHMQKWNANGADNLFHSLVDNAPALPDLRYIVLHSHIDVPWRDRARFRDDWIDKFNHVFKRRCPGPDRHNGSKLQYTQWRERSRRTQEKPEAEPEAEQVVDEVEQNGTSSTNEAPQRRSRRVADAYDAEQERRSHEASQLAVAGDVGLPEFDDLSVDTRPADPALQRLCDVVDIRIDNQRPRENQLTEQDFLDEEPSGDDDWQEDNDGVEAEGYAW